MKILKDYCEKIFVRFCHFVEVVVLFILDLLTYFFYFLTGFFLLDGLMVGGCNYIYLWHYEISWMWFIEHLSVFIIELPIVFFDVIFLIPKEKFLILRVLGLSGAIFIFLCSIWLRVVMNSYDIGFFFQHVAKDFYGYNITLEAVVDSFSLVFVNFVCFIFVIAICVANYSIKSDLKKFMFLFFLLEWMILKFFTTTNYLIMFIFFESILIPMILIIGFWGSQKERVHASYVMALYAIVTAVPMLLGILLLYKYTGSFEVAIVQKLVAYRGLDFTQKTIFFLIIAGFVAKIPLLPLHLWLPKAHVEAPTVGSIFLAAITLKMSLYGIIRFLGTVLIEATIYATPLVLAVSCFTLIVSSIVTIRQRDLKRLIAYSSVAHMAFTVLGIFSSNFQGIEGALQLMVGHGIVSTGLFTCAGILYDRFGTRNIDDLGGVVIGMPLYSLFFFILMLGNCGYPGTSNFVGEFLISLGIFSISSCMAVIAIFSGVFTGVYSLWVLNRVIFGDLRRKNLVNYLVASVPVEEVVPLKVVSEEIFLKKYADVTKGEFVVLFLTVFAMFVLGIFPEIMLGSLHSPTIDMVVELIKKSIE